MSGLCDRFLLQENKSALLWACWNKHDKVVKSLTKAGADVNSFDKVK